VYLLLRRRAAQQASAEILQQILLRDLALRCQSIDHEWQELREHAFEQARGLRCDRCFGFARSSERFAQELIQQTHLPSPSRHPL